MQEVKPVPTAHATPAPAPTTTSNTEPYIQRTPKWVFIVRCFQAFFAFVVLAMCGYLIHGHAMDANVFALVVCLMTWVVVAYTVVTEKFPGAHGSYNIWAVLSLDLLMAIFWLSSMGANAALRASFIYDVDVDYCVNDGSAVSSNTCFVSKRSLERRAAIAGSVGLAMMSAVAGLSALVMLLFIATLVFHGHTFRLYHQGKKTTPTDNGTVEMTGQQQTPILAQQPQQQQQQHVPGAAYPAYPAYPSQPQQQPQQYQGYAEAPPQPSVSPVYSNQSTSYTQHNTPPMPVPTPSPAPYEMPHGQPQAGPYQLPGQEHHQQQPEVHQLPGQEYPQQHHPGPYQLAGQEYPPQQQQQQQQAGPYQLAGSQPYGGNTDPNQAGAYHQQQQQQYYSPQGTPAPGQQQYYPPAH